MTQPDDHSPSEPLYGIADLARLGGVSRRTVRYYVQRGLLPVPTGTGRGSHYTQAHLDQLVAVRTLQEQGVPLAEIAARLDAAGPVDGAVAQGPETPETDRPPAAAAAHPLMAAPPPPPTSLWTRVALRDGVELHLRGVRLGPEQLGEMAALIDRWLEDPNPR